MDLPDRRAQRVVERVHRAVALGRAHEALAADPDLDRGLGLHLAVGSLLHEHAPRLEPEQRLVLSCLLSHEQLEGPVGDLELKALVLEFLDALEHALGELVAAPFGELDARRSRLLGDRPSPGQLGDEHVAAVAHDRGIDVLERLGLGAHARRVHARLVREGVLADVGLGRIGRPVEQLVDEVRRLGQPRQALLGEHLVAHLQLQVGDDRDQVGVARTLADAVDGSLHLRGARFDARERVGHRAAGVVVRVDAQRHRPERFAHDRECGADLRRQRAAVGIAQDDPLGAGLRGRAQALQRVARVKGQAVEEVLGVEEHALARGHEECDRLGDHLQVLRARDAQDGLHVQR